MKKTHAITLCIAALASTSFVSSPANASTNWDAYWAGQFPGCLSSGEVIKSWFGRFSIQLNGQVTNNFSSETELRQFCQMRNNSNSSNNNDRDKIVSHVANCDFKTQSGRQISVKQPWCQRYKASLGVNDGVIKLCGKTNLFRANYPVLFRFNNSDRISNSDAINWFSDDIARRFEQLYRFQPDRVSLLIGNISRVYHTCPSSVWRAARTKIENKGLLYMFQY